MDRRGGSCGLCAVLSYHYLHVIAAMLCLCSRSSTWQGCLAISFSLAPWRATRYAAFLYRSPYETVCRFLAPSLLVLRPLAIAFGLAPKPLCLRSGLLAVTLRLAHRELHERRGEAVRKLDHKYCQHCNQAIFCTRHVLAPISGASFSVGLRLAKITEVRAKEGLCLSRLRSSLLSDLFYW